MERTGIRVVDVMTSKVITVKPSDSLVTAAKKMNKYRIGGLPVVKGKKLVGLITERDIMRKIVAKNKLPNKFKVKDVMSSPPKITAHKFEDLYSIANKMAQYDVSRIPIVEEDGKLVGIITNKDVAEQAPQLLNLILEQARVKGPLDRITYPLSKVVSNKLVAMKKPKIISKLLHHLRGEEDPIFGTCEKCGAQDYLFLKENKYLCEFCSNSKQ